MGTYREYKWGVSDDGKLESKWKRPPNLSIAMATTSNGRDPKLRLLMESEKQRTSLSCKITNMWVRT